MKQKKYRMPDFLGIGTMKSGTSWTWRQLKKHPEVGSPRMKGRRVKEFHFFDKIRIPYKTYLSKFGRLKQEKVGEFTPNYFACPYAPKMIQSLLPEVKLFTIFRNPVDRAFSHYKDHLFKGKVPEGTTFLDAFNEDHPKRELKFYSIKAKGMYADLLENWRRFFGEDRLKVFFYDDLVADNVSFLKEVYKWVGVDPDFVPEEYEKKVLKKYNRHYDEMKMSAEDRAQLVEFYTPQVRKLSRLTGRKLEWY